MCNGDEIALTDSWAAAIVVVAGAAQDVVSDALCDSVNTCTREKYKVFKSMFMSMEAFDIFS